jgi:uncharacterized membrane protein
MTTQPTHTITIVSANKPLINLVRIIALVVCVVGPIGIGIMTDSDAMQWAGFVFGLLFTIGIARAMTTDKRFTTVDDAKAYLDQLKANGEAP